jgi:hypothetical protein
MAIIIKLFIYPEEIKMEDDRDFGYGKIVKSYTIMCASCGKAHTYSDQIIIDGKPHCYKGTAEAHFTMSFMWHKRKNIWLCWECVDDYDDNQPITLKLVEQNVK